jgi:hypothetical protein
MINYTKYKNSLGKQLDHLQLSTDQIDIMIEIITDNSVSNSIPLVLLSLFL